MQKAIVLFSLGFFTLSATTMFAGVDRKEPSRLSSIQSLEPELSNSMPIRQPSPSTKTTTQSQRERHISSSHFRAFTGKVLGSDVRVRLQPDVESPIIMEASKNDWLVIVDEKDDFYAIEPPSDMKAFIFRSFVLDNVVEGNRVNVRLHPELSSPVIGHLNTGDRVNGKISDENSKWLEIAPPKTTKFYIAKEFIENVGGPELKEVRDRKKSSLNELMASAELTSQEELAKPFDQINFDKLCAQYQTVVKDYAEFTDEADRARSNLLELQEVYLQKKLAHLEAKAAKLSKQLSLAKEANPSLDIPMDAPEPAVSDKMKSWIAAEETLFLDWSTRHPARSFEDYYVDQKTKAIRISGTVEMYTAPIKNKPGNFIIRDRDLPRAYLYSTKIDLERYVGKYVTLFASPRPNNNFAFPAYFVLDVE